MTEVDDHIDQPGAALRAARIRANIGLQEVSDQTRIALHRLQELERDDYEAVGGKAYVMGYARAYARVIGVDHQPFVAGLEAVFAEQQAAWEADRAVAVSRHRRRTRKLLLVGAVVALVVLLLGVYLMGAGQSEAGERREAPAASTAPQPTPATAPGVAERVAERTLPAIDEPEALAVHNSDLQPHSTAEPAETVDLEVPPQVQAVESGALQTALDRLHLSFTDDCWVEVADASGKTVIAQLAQSGDNLPASGRAPFDITLGNAGAVTVALNGEPVAVRPRSDRRVLKLRVGE